jgi:hypothetical protein
MIDETSVAYARCTASCGSLRGIVRDSRLRQGTVFDVAMRTPTSIFLLSALLVGILSPTENDAKKIGIFSGELSGTERTCTMEVSGPWYFPPVASLITAGGRSPA